MLNFTFPVFALKCSSIFENNYSLMIDNVTLNKSNYIVEELTKLNKPLYICGNYIELLNLPKKKLLLIDTKYKTYLKQLKEKIHIISVKYQNKPYIIFNNFVIELISEPEIPNIYCIIALYNDSYYHIGYTTQKIEKDILW